MSQLEENYKKAHNWRKRKQNAHREIIEMCNNALRIGKGNYHNTNLNEFEIRRIIELLKRK